MRTFVREGREGREREELLAEVVVTRGSPLHLRSLTDADLATGADVVPIAVHRGGSPRNVVRHGIEDLRLKAGDVLLLQGTRAAMDHLRQGIGLRSYAQKNPKQEYKREAFEMFGEMIEQVKHDTISILSRIRVQSEEDLAAMEARRKKEEQMKYQHA